MASSVAEVESPLVGMYFLVQRVVSLAKDGYRYVVQGGFAQPQGGRRPRGRRLAL